MRFWGLGEVVGCDCTGCWICVLLTVIPCCAGLRCRILEFSFSRAIGRGLAMLHKFLGR